MEKRFLISNYHTHTTRCGHACGEDREYVEEAIKAGIKILGFSDHTPYPTGFKSGMRIALEETEGYFNSVVSLREEYKNDIKIYAGVEAEYFPEYFEKLVEYLGDYPLDYMILGNHFVDDEEHGFYLGDKFTDKKYLDKYVKNVIAGINSGKFIYVAHPDLPNFVGENADEELSRAMEEIAVAAKAKNIPLEINVLGYRRGIQYPSERLLKICEKVGNEMIYGLDVHNPRHFHCGDLVEELKNIVNKYNIKVLDKIEIESRNGEENGGIFYINI